MNRLISHIEFLLHEHNCVIIPDLGGFVINAIQSYRDDNNLLNPPACELVFNRDLTHNDGLLAESYMKTYDLSFERAMWRIENEVVELKQILRDKSYLDLDKLGSFSLTEDNRFRYTPGVFVRPEYFGLTAIKLQNLVTVEKTVPLNVSETSRGGKLKKIGFTAAAVAAIILFMFVLPVSDTAIERQTANISYETKWFRPKQSTINTQPAHTDVKANEFSDVKSENLIVANETETPSVEISITASDISTYYIVMGVFRGEISASKLIESLKDEGFNSANWLERPYRYDVYAASFNNEAEAETYLKEVHKKYPKHIDAWILER
jgi:hypothetical protein